MHRQKKAFAHRFSNDIPNITDFAQAKRLRLVGNELGGRILPSRPRGDPDNMDFATEKYIRQVDDVGGEIPSPCALRYTKYYGLRD